METNPYDSNSEIADYWAKAATRSGRTGLNIRARIKRLTWSLVIGSTLAIKRLFDIVVSGFALIALSPILLGTAALIKLEEKGQVFFKQNLSA